MNTVALTLSDGILKNNRPCRLRALMTRTLALLPVTRTIGVFTTGAQVLPTVGVKRPTDSSSKKSRARCLLMISGQDSGQDGARIQFEAGQKSQLA